MLGGSGFRLGRLVVSGLVFLSGVRMFAVIRFSIRLLLLATRLAILQQLSVAS